MNETPKKPRKKAAPKPRADALADAPAKKADASADAQAKTQSRDDRQMREAVLAAALPHIAFDGFTASMLQKAGAEAGVSKADLARLFEDGPVSLIEVYSTHTDAEMERRLTAMDLKAM